MTLLLKSHHLVPRRRLVTSVYSYSSYYPNNDTTRYFSTTTTTQQEQQQQQQQQEQSSTDPTAVNHAWSIIQTLSLQDRQELSRHWMEKEPTTACVVAPHDLGVVVHDNDNDDDDNDNDNNKNHHHHDPTTTMDQVFEKMDTNADGAICKQEFQAYIIMSQQQQQQRRRMIMPPYQTNQSKKDDNKATTAAHDDDKEQQQQKVVVPPVSWSNYQQLALCTALPFVGFGFLDNFLMLAAGEYIDAGIGQTLGLSTMAAAAWGNTFSDVAGIGASGVISNWTDRLGLPSPQLQPAQWQLPATRGVVLVSSAMGITVGCFMGMVPLLWL